MRIYLILNCKNRRANRDLFLSSLKIPGMVKETNGNASAATPKTAQAISLILQSMGVEDAEPRVVHQLLDLTFRMRAYSNGIVADSF